MVRCRLRIALRAAACPFTRFRRASEARLKRVRSFEIPKSWLYKLKGLGFAGPVKRQKWLLQLFVNTSE